MNTTGATYKGDPGTNHIKTDVHNEVKKEQRRFILAYIDFLTSSASKVENCGNFPRVSFITAVSNKKYRRLQN